MNALILFVTELRARDNKHLGVFELQPPNIQLSYFPLFRYRVWELQYEVSPLTPHSTPIPLSL